MREVEERLFHTNLFSIITHGTEVRLGTITGEFDHYLNWKDIFSEEYRTIEIAPGEGRQEGTGKAFVSVYPHQFLHSTYLSQLHCSWGNLKPLTLEVGQETV